MSTPSHSDASWDHLNHKLVRFTRGEEVVIGRVRGCSPTDEWANALGVRLEARCGWTPEVIAEPEEFPLPTEPGLYVKSTVSLHEAVVFVLSPEGVWSRSDGSRVHHDVLRRWHEAGLLVELVHATAHKNAYNAGVDAMRDSIIKAIEATR